MRKRSFLQAMLAAFGAGASMGPAAVQPRPEPPPRAPQHGDGPGPIESSPRAPQRGDGPGPNPQRLVVVQLSPVAGFQYHEGERVWPLLRPGDHLELRREPDNPHDERAVGVRWNEEMLGYVPRLENTAVAQMLDRGEVLHARIVSLEESGNPWERVGFEVVLEA